MTVTFSQQWENKKQELEQELLLIKGKRQELYEDMKEEILTQEEFTREWGRLTGKLEQYKKELVHMEKEHTPEKEAIKMLSGCQYEVLESNKGEIPLEVLDVLIEKIDVFSPERIRITYTCMDLIDIWHSEMQLEILDGKTGTGNE